METANEVQQSKLLEMRDEQLHVVQNQLKESELLVAELQKSRRRSRAFGTFVSALIAALSFTIAAFLLANIMLNLGISP